MFDFLLIPVSFLHDMLTLLLLLLLLSALVNLWHPLFWYIYLLLIVLLGTCPHLPVDPCWICSHIIQWAASLRMMDVRHWIQDAYRIIGSDIKDLRLWVILFLRSWVWSLIVYMIVLTQLLVRIWLVVVIPVKVTSGSARHGWQCRSSELSLTLVLCSQAVITHGYLVMNILN